ncbi:MAG: hypothetical protein ACR2NA_08855 [Solirubrobacterales bacterium]
MILMAVPAVALLAAFWFFVLAPKRAEVSTLSEQVTQLETEVSEAERAADLAESSKASFPDLYQALVRMGKAVPTDDDAGAFIVETNRLAKRTNLDFRSISLDSARASSAADQAAQAPPPPEEGKKPEGEDGKSEDAEQTASAKAPAAATPTEADAAMLPLGAASGPAGFPVMPYQLEFSGTYFRLADFIREMDRSVRVRNDQIHVRGRLATIDGFTLKGNTGKGFPRLDGLLVVTTYLTNPDEGTTVGASPTGPPAGQTQEVANDG